MSDALIREYQYEDIPAMKQLWQRVFNDCDELIDAFFELLPDMGTAIVAEHDGEIVGIAGVIVGMELIGDGIESKNCGYLYALAVDEPFRGRGIGARLITEAYKLAEKREAKIVSLLPEDPSLYAWYERILGLRCVLHRCVHEVDASAIELAAELSSTEYMLWRETMLKGKVHLHPSTPTMEFQRRYCKALGGGLFACASGICSAYLSDNTAIINELISMSQADIPAIAASVAALLGAEKAVYYLPSRDGTPYICTSCDIPTDCIWNLSFD